MKNIKFIKITQIFVCILAVFGSVSFLNASNDVHKSGVLAGISLGGALNIWPSQSSNIFPHLKGIEIGAMLGYQRYFSQSFGARFYANYGFQLSSGSKNISQNNGSWNHNENINITNNGHRFDINVDILYDFLQNNAISVGGIAGVFGGMNNVTNNVNLNIDDEKRVINHKFNGAQFGLNVGLRMAFNNHNIDLLAKIPFNNLTNTSETSRHPKLHFYAINMQYSYVF